MACPARFSTTSNQFGADLGSGQGASFWLHSSLAIDPHRADRNGRSTPLGARASGWKASFSSSGFSTAWYIASAPSLRRVGSCSPPSASRSCVVAPTAAGSCGSWAGSFAASPCCQKLLTPAYNSGRRSGAKPASSAGSSSRTNDHTSGNSGFGAWNEASARLAFSPRSPPWAARPRPALRSLAYCSASWASENGLKGMRSGLDQGRARSRRFWAASPISAATASARFCTLNTPCGGANSGSSLCNSATIVSQAGSGRLRSARHHT